MSDTRLTSRARIPALSDEKVPFVNFRQVEGSVLITNDVGQWQFLKDSDFDLYLEGKLPADSAQLKELSGKNLLRTNLDFDALAEKTAQKELLHWEGPLVHTIVVTRRCNFKCLYCHASIVDVSKKSMDMSLETAKKTVDFIFSTPQNSLHLEFQGGEPLLNWGAVQFIVEYAQKKAQWLGRKVQLSLISNLSLLDETKLDFLEKRKVSICTSLDGPSELHNKNRIFLGGNGHSESVRWIDEIQARRAQNKILDTPNAICTVSRFSFPYWKEIIDQVVDLGMERVQLGPLDPIGFARKSWNQIGYEPEEFLAFYEKALDYILKLNAQGVKIYEKMALIFLLRILKQGHWRFPNGDALCRLAYNFNGEIYTSEEGRLLAHEGDSIFNIGHVESASYPEILNHPLVRASLLASRVDNQPQCWQCAYKPYCTLTPVMNYALQDNLHGHMPTNRWCRMMMGLFDILFKKIQNPKDAELLNSWLEYETR